VALITIYVSRYASPREDLQIMARKSIFILAFCLTTSLVFAQTDYNYQTLDYPAAKATYPNSINNAGAIVGTYTDTNNVGHGFYYYQGKFSPINFPQAVGTLANGINNKGIIVGLFEDTSSTYHGFILNRGSYVQFDIPGSSYTSVNGINDSDTLAGTYTIGTGNIQGFVQAVNSKYVTEDYPGTTETSVNAINNAGDLTGQTNIDFLSAFLYSDGQWTDFTYPNAIATTGDGINNLNQIVGIYSPTNPSEPSEGFIRGADGTMQALFVPKSTGTGASGINDVGIIVGNYTDSSGVTHGVVAIPISGNAK
jgi:probable HAF family extracellular repeat protein